MIRLCTTSWIEVPPTTRRGITTNESKVWIITGAQTNLHDQTRSSHRCSHFWHSRESSDKPQLAADVTHTLVHTNNAIAGPGTHNTHPKTIPTKPRAYRRESSRSTRLPAADRSVHSTTERTSPQTWRNVTETLEFSYPLRGSTHDPRCDHQSSATCHSTDGTEPEYKKETHGLQPCTELRKKYAPEQC
jgi:hypothetical protein